MNQGFKRLEQVVEQYFDNFSTLAKIMRKSHTIFYRYQERPFGKKMLNDFENVGINPKYIDEGKRPKLVNFDYITKNKAEAISEYNRYKENLKVIEEGDKYKDVTEVLHETTSKITLYNYTVQAAMGGIQSVEDLMPSEIPLSVGIKLNPKRDKAVYVHGESMKDAGLHSGDIVIYDTEKTPQNGHWVICLLNGHLILKEFHKEGDKLTLKSKNGDNGDIDVGELEDFRILGVVKRIIKETPY